MSRLDQGQRPDLVPWRSIKLPIPNMNLLIRLSKANPHYAGSIMHCKFLIGAAIAR